MRLGITGERLERAEEREVFHTVELRLRARQRQNLVGRRNGVQLRAHERFVRHRLARTQVDDGLEVILDETLLQQAVQVLLVVDDERLLLVALPIEREQIPLAAALRQVHGEVGVFAQVSEVRRILGIERCAHGRAHLERLSVGRHDGAGIEHGAERGEKVFHRCAIGAYVDEHEELVTGDARVESLVPERLVHHAARRLDVLIAPIVPVDIVDELEVVEVEHQHRSQRRRALREQVGNLLLECTAVEQPGEDVMVALMLDAATRLDLMRHVLHEAEHAVVLAAFHHHETNPRGSMRAREEVAALFLHLDVGNVPFHKALELARAQRPRRNALRIEVRGIRRFQRRQRGEEPVGKGDDICFVAVLEGADAAVGQAQDAR